MSIDPGEVAASQDEASVASNPAVQTPGALLEQERNRRGWSIQQAAEGLHLDTWIIEAIEANKFLALGAPVYAKGYLRKYATLLGLAPDVIVARYDALTDTLPEPTPVPVITTTPPPRPKWPKYLAWALLAAIVIALGVAAFNVLWPVATSTSLPATMPQEEAGRAEAPNVAASESSQMTASPAPAPAETVVPATSLSDAAPSPVPATASPATSAVADVGAEGESVSLALAFSEASWAEVHDARGERLFYDIGQAGRTRVVTGTAPLNVVIGVADAVQVRVNDRDIVVPRRANRESARFVVAADGSVR